MEPLGRRAALYSAGPCCPPIRRALQVPQRGRRLRLLRHSTIDSAGKIQQAEAIVQYLEPGLGLVPFTRAERGKATARGCETV